VWASPTPKTVTRSVDNRLLRLPVEAPDIAEAILDGRQPNVMQLEELIQSMPRGWKGQRRLLAIGG
jgi:hypothetical protein